MSFCLSSRFLIINNAKKSKYMIVTRKPQSFVCWLPPLYVKNLHLELVTSYKYLGAILTCKLSWSPHIQAICSKVRKVIGFVYHTFYKHCTFQTLVKLYVSFALPYLTYCSSVWDPPPHTINALIPEKVQLFVLKVCSKKWSASYIYLSPYLPPATLPIYRVLTLQTYPSFQVSTQSHLSSSKFTSYSQ